MKITIYVNEKYIENLYRFILDGKVRPVEWYHDRPGYGAFNKFIMVTINYNDFVKLNELSE